MEDSSFFAYSLMGQCLGPLLATVPFLYAAGPTRSILPRVELRSSQWQACTLASEVFVQSVISVLLESHCGRREKEGR